MQRTLNLSRQRYELENPLIVLRNLLQCLGVQVAEEDIARIQHHPDYPSLSSLSSALHGWGIETFAAQINKAQLSEISFPAIAHSQKYGGQFLVLTEFKDDQVTYHDSESGWITEHVDEFAKQWTGIVLLVDKSELSGDPDSAEKIRREKLTKTGNRISTFFLVGIVCTVLYAVYDASGILMTLSTLCFIAGAVVSVVIVFSEIGNTWVKSFCSIGKNIDCNSILKSPAATLFGWLKMSDVGVVWFFTASLSVVSGMISDRLIEVFSILAAGSFFAAFYIPFSILYQWLVAKKWCSLCLAVQALLAINVLLLGYHFQFESLLSIDLTAIFIVFAIMASVIVVLIQLKPQFIKAQQLEVVKRDLTTFKLDHELFAMALEKQPVVEIEEYAKEITIGSLTAPANLVLVLSPLCESCATAFRTVLHMVRRMPEKLNVTFRFSTSTADDSTSVVSHLYSLPDENREKALEDWFSVRDFKRWAKLYPTDVQEDAQQIADRHQIWLSWVRISRTPSVLMNRRKVPAQYTLDDLQYLLANMKFEESVDQQSVL